MRKNPDINESFISRIWEKTDEFCNTLFTENKEELKIIEKGKLNEDGGPDYLNAVVKIGEKILRGDIEIHKDFNSWFSHKHSNDKKYNTVILQVVLWEKGKRKPQLQKARYVPTVILSQFLKYSILDIWQDIISKPSAKLKIHCSEQNRFVSRDSITNMLYKCSDERFDMKVARMKIRLGEISKYAEKDLNDKSIWEQLLYEFIFEALGYSKNKEPFVELTKNLNIYKIRHISKNIDDKLAIQAALFGYAGFLNDQPVNDYHLTKLNRAFSKIKKIIKAGYILKSEWQFFRLRPQNFPTVRLAYGVQIVNKIINESLLQKIITLFESDHEVNYIYRELKLLFKPAIDLYWNNHFNFNKVSADDVKLIGKDRITEIIINIILPFVKLYTEYYQNDIRSGNVRKFYHEHSFTTSNSIVRLLDEQLFRDNNIRINKPALHQGAIQLYSFYCLRNKCSNCIIGRQTFKETGYDYKIIYY